VEWLVDKAPVRAEVRLVWATDGRGTREHHTVDSAVLSSLGRLDRRAFRLRLPEMPYSFSGRVLTIYWRVELVLQYQFWPRPETIARRISMSPTGVSVDPSDVRK
jgi:hypothetical protein